MYLESFIEFSFSVFSVFWFKSKVGYDWVVKIKTRQILAGSQRVPKKTTGTSSSALGKALKTSNLQWANGPGPAEGTDMKNA